MIRFDVDGTGSVRPAGRWLDPHGTWWFGRSGWCQGQEVPLLSVDVTDQVLVGEDNIFDYEGYYRSAPYPGSGARIEMRSWLVLWR